MPPVAKKTVKPKPTGTFARLKAEASKGRPEPEPYVIDDVEPPIVITAPTETERQLGIAELFGSNGAFQVKDARRILELICGDAFPQVWELLRREHLSVMLKMVDEMGEHFAEALDFGAGDFPGGSEASSA